MAFECEFCSKKYSSEKRLDNHISKTHQKDEEIDQEIVVKKDQSYKKAVKIALQASIASKLPVQVKAFTIHLKRTLEEPERTMVKNIESSLKLLSVYASRFLEEETEAEN